MAACRLYSSRTVNFSKVCNRILAPRQQQNIRWNLCHTDYIKSPFADACIGEVNIGSDNEGHGFCELQLTKTHMNRRGTIHGGCIATLIDVVSAKGLFGNREPRAVSIDLSVSFLAPALEGDVIIIESETVKTTKHLAFYEVKIYKKVDKTLLATGKHTQYMLDNPKYFNDTDMK